VGDYLRRFGESIYGTRSWTSFGEGPTKMGGGSFTGPVAGVAKDVRFTRNTAGTVLYLTALGWQGSTMTVSTLTPGRLNLATLVSAQLLDNTSGSYLTLPRPAQDGAGLHFTMPSATAPFTALAYVVKLTFSGRIPG